MITDYLVAPVLAKDKSKGYAIRQRFTKRYRRRWNATIVTTISLKIYMSSLDDIVTIVDVASSTISLRKSLPCGIDIIGNLQKTALLNYHHDYDIDQTL